MKKICEKVFASFLSVVLMVVTMYVPAVAIENIEDEGESGTAKLDISYSAGQNGCYEYNLETNVAEYIPPVSESFEEVAPVPQILD